MEKSGVGYLGVVQVPLRQMQFMEEVGERLHDTRQTERLQALFQNTAADHENYRHWVDGYIDNTEVSSFVNKLGLSRQELKQHNLDGNYPRLDDQVVCFTQGRHRIEAASNINPYDLWTVRLSCMSLSQIQTNQIVKSRTEQYQHETPDSDGRIYSKLRQYGDRGFEFHEWHQRLSKKKQYIFRRITQLCPMVEALDLLIQLPGVLDFLQLGCYGTVFDNRLFEECITGWNLIFAEWSKFTLGSRLLRSSIDRDTVVALEGRAPAASEADREWIHQAFTSGQVWSRITDPQQRCELESRVQSTTVIIPGLRWLQGNLVYLNIAARIIWKLIVPEKEGRKAERKKLSLQQILQSYWVASESKSCVEIQEGVFQPVHGPASFNLAYNQLMLAALRQFPYLSKPDPKGKSGEKLGLSLDLNCISLFHKRAALLGFRSSVIQQGVAIVRPPFQPREWTTGKDSTSFNEVKFFSQMYHRWGKPHVHVFRVIQTSAFLPKLTRARSHSEVDITYVLQDLLRTFVKPCSFDCDLSGRCIYLNVGIDALQYHSAVVGTRPANCHTRNAGLQTIEEASESSNNNRYGPDYLTCTQPEPISTAFMHDHVRRRDGIITRGGTATSSYVSYDGERGTRPGPLEPQRHRNSYRSSATKGQRELLRQPLVVGRHSFGMRDILERQSWLVEQGRRIMSSDESSSFENSTCSRSALPSPPVSSQEYHAVEHLSDEFRQPSFVSSEYSRSTIPTPPVCAPAQILPSQGCRPHGNASHSQSRKLRPLLPATNIGRPLFARSPGIQSSKPTAHSFNSHNGPTGRQFGSHHSIPQKEGQYEEAPNLWQPIISPTLSRSTILNPRSMSQASLSSLQSNSETETIWSSQCHDDQPAFANPSHFSRSASYIRAQLSPSISTRSTRSRSPCPTPRVPQSSGVCFMEPHKMEDLHRFLRTLPRGASSCRPDGWEGFDDSNDLETISM